MRKEKLFAECNDLKQEKLNSIINDLKEKSWQISEHYSKLYGFNSEHHSSTNMDLKQKSVEQKQPLKTYFKQMFNDKRDEAMTKIDVKRAEKDYKMIKNFLMLVKEKTNELVAFMSVYE